MAKGAYHVVLYHPNTRACEEIREATAQHRAVDALCGDYLTLKCNGLLDGAASVAAGNSYGIMDGGLDLVMRDVHGVALQHSVQRQICERHGGLLPVGSAVGVVAPDAQYIVYAPTMLVPMDIRGTCNVYLAARAAVRQAVGAGYHTIYMPLLGTGTGRMALRDALIQTLAGVEDGAKTYSPGDLAWDRIGFACRCLEGM